MEILNYSEEHLDKCSELYADTFNSPPWYDQWTKSTAAQRLNDIVNTPGFIGLIAVEDGVVLGAALGNLEHWYEGYMFNFKEMFVSQDLRGKGVGTKIIAALDPKLKESGAFSISMFTLEGDMTEKFYLKNGYRREQGMVMMTKDLLIAKF